MILIAPFSDVPLISRILFAIHYLMPGVMARRGKYDQFLLVCQCFSNLRQQISIEVPWEWQEFVCMGMASMDHILPC